MTEDHAKKIGIPEGHKLVKTGFKWLGAKRGQDSDVYHYDELNEAGEVVGKHEVTVSTSTFPPFSTTTEVS